jgi:hypothetical protein
MGFHILGNFFMSIDPHVVMLEPGKILQGYVKMSLDSQVIGTSVFELYKHRVLSLEMLLC